MFEGTELDQMLRRVIHLDEDTVFVEVSDREVLDTVSELNREQLREGKNAKGELLSDIGGEYSDLTLQIAAEEGRPKKSKSTVDLLNEGEFHKSIDTTVNRQGYDITSDPMKEDFTRTTNLESRWGPDITGLNDQKVDKLIEEKLEDKYVGYLEKNIF